MIADRAHRQNPGCDLPHIGAAGRLDGRGQARGSPSLESPGPFKAVRSFMSVLLVLGVPAALLVLYAADRVVKALVRARRLRRMSERLAVAAARAERQQAKKEAAAQASAALTSVMPAINHRPPATLPGQLAREDEPQA
jgi:hypothetical protein